MKKPINKKKLIRAAAFSLCVILLVAGWIIYSGISGSLITQDAADRFRGETGGLFGQVSAFYKAGESGTEDEIRSFRQKLSEEYVAASLEAPAGGSLFKDCYSAEGRLSVRGDRAAVELTALGVGGDWFFFHPLKLISGSYINETDLMSDGVVLDEEAAWRLFGGFDLAGLKVYINDVPYVVVGVCETEKDEATKAAYSGEPRIFMHYSALNAISETGITEYEVAGADPIGGFLKDITGKSFEKAVIVENSSRFEPGRIFKLIGDFGTRSMRKEAVALPYWENAARYNEDRLAFVLLVIAILGVYPAVCIIVTVVRLIGIGTGSLKKRLPDLKEKISERRYDRKAGR